MELEFLNSASVDDLKEIITNLINELGDGIYFFLLKIRDIVVLDRKHLLKQKLTNVKDVTGFKEAFPLVVKLNDGNYILTYVAEKSP